MKALASDFDNTLHFRNENGDGYIKDIDRKAIARFRRNGNLFGSCTGRAFCSLMDDIEDSLNMDFNIVSTGGCIKDENNHILYEKTIDGSIAHELYEAMKKEVDFFFHTGDSMLVLEDSAFFGSVYRIFRDHDELVNTAYTGISGRCDTEEQSMKAVNRINELFPMLSAYQNGNWMDIVMHGISKGTGVTELKKLKKIDLVAAIGDARNDIPSLRSADISFTFHSSPADVQQEADYLIDTVAEAIAILEKL